MADDYLWWRDGIIYQIYPRSFHDSNNDGFGDLAGITSRLDYLADLGVDAIWLSPIYPSPDKDFGYDVSDYLGIDPRYGTMQDFENLLLQAHQRGIHIILDLVLNHTSNEHPWFEQSRSSIDNPYRGWYMWHPGKGAGKLPNNWQASFGGNAWEFDSQTGEYYFHLFTKEQPDLNWRNTEVRNEMLNVFRFWLNKGVDGFRLDVFNVFFKDAELRDNPPRFGIRGFDRQKHIYDANRPEMFPLVEEICGIVDEYLEKYVVGETYLATPEETVDYTGEKKLHAAFNFTMLSKPWNAVKFAQAIIKWDDLNQGRQWPNQVLNNHDVKRSSTRYNFDVEDRLAKVAATLMLTLRGTPFLYYGEEIGMRDISLSRKEILDPPGRKYWPFYKGRDGCRSPMQWNADVNAGFSESKPWLPVHPKFKQRNVSAQLGDPNSLLSYYKKLIHLRHTLECLRRGSFKMVESLPASILGYTRDLSGTRILILLNFRLKKVHFTLPEGYDMDHYRILINSLPETTPIDSSSQCIELQPGHALIICLS
jgi:alpha-glucosidase